MSHTPNQKSLMKGVTEIDTLCSALDLSTDINTRATEIYRKVAGHSSILKQYGTKVTAAACVLLATREASTPVTAEDIETHSDNDMTVENHILTNLKAIRNELDLELTQTDPHALIDQITDELCSPGTIKKEAHALADKITNTPLTAGRKAKTVAAACVYLVGTYTNPGGRNYYSQKQLQEVANVSDSTLRDCYKNISEHIEEKTTKYIDTNQLQQLN